MVFDTVVRQERNVEHEKYVAILALWRASPMPGRGLANVLDIYTTIAALGAKTVLKIGPISTRTVSIRHQSSRKFVYAYMLPIRDLLIARFLPLSLVFYEQNQKEFRIATVAIFRCDLYAAVFPQMSPPPSTKNCARLRTTKHNCRFYSFINKISVHGSRRFIFTGSCSATHGLLLS